MVRIERATQLPAPPDTVFAAFHTRAGRLALGRGYVEDVEVEGEGVGALIRIHTHGHIGRGYVVERTEHFDPVNRELEILMLDNGGYAPVADYRARVRVFAAGPGGSVVCVQTSFVPVDMDDAAALALIGQNYDLLMQNLHALFPGARDK